MASFNRRNLLRRSLTTATSAGLSLHANGPVVDPAPAGKPDRIIDTHVYLSRWPGRRMAGDATSELVASLREHGVVEAWAGSFDALLHKDIAALNSRLADECQQHGKNFLVPFGAVNPKLPDWEEDLRRCREQFRMPGIRLHPNYQHYTLRDAAFVRLLQLSADCGLIVQIVAWMEDERTQNPLLQVPIVDLSPLPVLLEKVPGARVVVLNGFMSASSVDQTLLRLKKFDHLAFDLAMLEGLMGLKAMIELVGVERVVFGSYSPMFYFESALLKLQEAALTLGQSRAILNENARRLLGKA